MRKSDRPSVPPKPAHLNRKPVPVYHSQPIDIPNEISAPPLPPRPPLSPFKLLDSTPGGTSRSVDDRSIGLTLDAPHSSPSYSTSLYNNGQPGIQDNMYRQPLTRSAESVIPVFAPGGTQSPVTRNFLGSGSPGTPDFVNSSPTPSPMSPLTQSRPMTPSSNGQLPAQSSAQLQSWQLETALASTQPPERVAGQLPSPSGIFLDEKYLLLRSISSSKTVLYDLRTWKIVSDSPGKYCAFAKQSPDRVWAGTKDGSIAILTLPSLAPVVTFAKAHIKPVSNIWVFPNQGAAVSLSLDDGKVNVWTINDVSRPSRSFRAIPNAKCAAYGRYLLVARGKNVYVYDPIGRQGTGFQLGAGFSPSTAGHGTVGEVTCMESGNGDWVLIGHNDGTVTIVKGNAPQGTINVGIHTVTQLVRVSETGNTITYWVGSRIGTVIVLNVNITTGKVRLERQWKASNMPVVKIVASSQGRPRVATSDLKSTQIWDATPVKLAERTKDGPRKNYRVKILSWNLGACTPKQVDWHWLKDPIINDDGCDLLVVGFQEILELESKSQTARNLVVGSEFANNSYDDWRDFLQALFEPLGLLLIETKPLIGLYTCVFAHYEVARSIHKISTHCIKTGMGGNYGNKGAIITQFEFFNSSFSFVNCHLAAGHTAITQRNKDAELILYDSKTKVMLSEFSFFFGDTNYRLSAVRERVEGLVAKEDWEKMKKYDQLTRQIANNPTFCLAAFMEAPINFPPTYKFDVGSTKYDTSDKKRVPSWCDRILYRGEGVTVDEYTSLTTSTSDHRPVYASFQVDVLL